MAFDFVEQNTIQGEFYVYSTWSGRLKLHKCTSAYTAYKNGHWRMSGGNKSFETVSEEGVVHNSIVWFYERNDELAIERLVEYKNRKIDKLEHEIKKVKWEIDAIRYGVYTSI